MPFELVCVAAAATLVAPEFGVRDSAAYLLALRHRFQENNECFPGELPEEELERILNEEGGALPPTLAELALDERFFPASTVWTGNSGQGPSGQAIPARLSFSFPNDGVMWGIPSRPVVPNDLNSGLGHVFGGANFDLGREMLRQALAGWRRTAGLSYFEVADDNSPQDTLTAPSAQRGDIRVGGGFTWPDTYLAYNFFPSGGGDMFYNSRYWETASFLGNPGNSNRYLRNVMAHEHGHGLGFFHVVPCNQVFNMEPFLATTFDMQQIDDLRNAHHNYGDRFAGNSSAGTAKDFGALTSGGTVKSVIERTLSTNGVAGPGNSDEDWFRFSISNTQNIVISVVPVGGVYDNGSQSSGCSGSISSVNAGAAGNLNVELRDSTGAVVILNEGSQPAGSTETLTATSRPAGTYTVRVIDVGPNDPVNQVVQLYDLTIRLGASTAPPAAIAGVDKRIGVGVPCQFIGDINSRATETGATITAYDWDLDGNGTFEVLNTARPVTTYTSPGSRNVTLRVTDSNAKTDTDTIIVSVFSQTFALHSVTPYPFRNAQGMSVPVTLFGSNLGAVSSYSISGVGTALVGTPVVNPAGTEINGLSVQVAADAPRGTRVITGTGAGHSSSAAFYLYPLSPGAFSITAPGNGTMTMTTNPLIEWTPSAWAVQYFVQIADDPSFDSNGFIYNSPNTLSQTQLQTPFNLLSPGSVYFARVRARNETGPDVFTPTVSFTAGSGSTNNDLCSNAIVVGNGLRAYTNVASSTDGPAEPACISGGYDGFESDVWFRYTATCTGQVTASICGSTFDSMIAVYAGACPIGGGAVVTCNDDACGTSSQVVFMATAGGVYYIRIAGFFGEQGYGTLNLSCFSTCPGDANNDQQVNFADVSAVLASWGANYAPLTGIGDADHDGDVDFGDITAVLSNFGVPCPP